MPISRMGYRNMHMKRWLMEHAYLNAYLKDGL